LRVTLCNVQLSTRTGTEIVTRDFALGLLKRGHEVSVLTQANGPIAQELRANNIQVTLNHLEIPRPDVIHIHHNMTEALQLLQRYPDVPALSMCHDSRDDYTFAANHPSIKTLFGVSLACRLKVAADTGIALDNIGTFHNYVDLEKMPLRQSPLPLLPAQWLFVGEKYPGDDMAEMLRNVADRFGARLRTVGPFAERHLNHVVENLAPHFVSSDLVFASARCAIEAAATGAGVIVTDPRGIAGFLGPRPWRKWSDHNLGLGCFSKPVTPLSLAKSVLRWNPWKAAAVSNLVRQERALTMGLDRLEAIYDNLAALR
jgi:hypothetical protein